MSAVTYALSIPVSVVPAVALVAVFRRLDRARRTPWRALYTTMAFGALACAPAALIEWLLARSLGDASLVGGRFVDAFVVAAMTEETVKLVAVLAYPMRRGDIDEVRDGIAYTVAASLGLGLLENVGYAANDVAAGLARAITAVPMHAIASGAMGYFVGRARFAGTQNVLPLCMAGWFVAVSIHGGYDWAVYNHDAYWFAESFAVLIVGGLLLVSLIRNAKRIDESMFGRGSLPTSLLSQWPTEVTQTLVPASVKKDGVVPAAVSPEAKHAG